MEKLTHNGFEQAPQPRPSRKLAEKWVNALLQSKRVIAAMASGLVALLGPYLVGLDEELALAIVTQIVAWIVSDSIRPTDNVFTSRRFWAMVAGAIVTLAAKYGISVDAETLTGIVMVVVSWVIGDGIRATLSGRAKKQQKLRYRTTKSYPL